MHVLSYLHAKGIVHRDLKSENSLLQSSHRHARVLIADFGFAKSIVKGNTTRTTMRREESSSIEHGLWHSGVYCSRSCLGSLIFRVGGLLVSRCDCVHLTMWLSSLLGWIESCPNLEKNSGWNGRVSLSLLGHCLLRFKYSTIRLSRV